MNKSIGLIGCGRWGKNILRDLCQLNTKVAVIDPSISAQTEAINIGAYSIHNDIMKEMNQLDGFIISSPTITHAEIIKKLVHFNKPIFVEKPLTCNINTARDLENICKDNIFVMDKWRYHPGIQELSCIINSGELGNIQAIQTYRLGWGCFHDDVDSLWILLPHDLSIALHLLGNLFPVKSLSTLIEDEPSQGISITLQGENTPKIIIEMSILHPITKRSVVVIGDQGSAQLGNADDNFVILCKKDVSGQPSKVIKKIETSSIKPLFLELQTFLQYLQGGPSPKSSLKEGILIVEKISEIRQRLNLKSKKIASTLNNCKQPMF